jgi:hypothetical protein
VEVAIPHVTFNPGEPVLECGVSIVHLDGRPQTSPSAHLRLEAVGGNRHSRANLDVFAERPADDAGDRRSVTADATRVCLDHQVCASPNGLLRQGLVE